MPATLDHIMEDASAALARMDYLACESLCLEALGAARGRGDWAYYSRILLPLQEARRQRRMIAAEGTVRLGTTAMNSADEARMASLETGCLVLTHPLTHDAARDLNRRATANRRFIEVLFADNAADAPHWTLRSFDGPGVTCVVQAPPQSWLNVWIQPRPGPGSRSDPAIDVVTPVNGKTPADWFIDATEALGDAALPQLAAGRAGLAEIEALESCLHVVTDHEIIHQRLAAAARAMALMIGPKSE